MTEIVANGLTYTLNDRFTEGHALSAPEAAALNGLLARKVSAAWSQLGRNASKRGAADFDNSQDAFERYVGNYRLGQARGLGTPRTSDPVITEARKIVREALTAQLKNEGTSIKGLAKEKVAAFIEANIKREDVLAYARQRVQANQSFNLGSITDTPSAEQLPAETDDGEGEDTAGVAATASRGRRR